MARFVAAVVTIVNGRVKAKADPRISDRPGNASLALACTVAEARVQRELAGTPGQQDGAAQ
jgi:hypothetical protein